MPILKKLINFSNSGIHYQDEKILVGVGCWEWSLPIVEDVIKNWLNEESVKNLREKKWDIGMIVGAVVFNQTKEDFSWKTVSLIIEISSKNRMNEGFISIFSNQYPLGINKFSFSPGARNVKRVAQDMAKSILWIESLTFLIKEGYSDRLE